MDPERKQDQSTRKARRAGDNASAGRRTVGRERLRELVLGVPPPELEGTRDYARYQRLLPQMLAGTLEAQSRDYRWFMAFIDRWDVCFAEYQDLQRAIDDD